MIHRTPDGVLLLEGHFLDQAVQLFFALPDLNIGIAGINIIAAQCAEPMPTGLAGNRQTIGYRPVTLLRWSN